MAISIAWGIVATIVIIVMPLWESWDGICLVVKGLLTNDDVHMRMDVIEVGTNLNVNLLVVALPTCAPSTSRSLTPCHGSHVC